MLAGSAAEHRLAALSEEVERAIDANLRWLGASSPRGRLRLFFVGSRGEMRPLTGGSTPGGWSVTSEGTAFFVGNDSVHPALRHETMHLLSWRLWGTPVGEWLSEGVASMAGGQCRGWSFEDVAAALDRDHRLVPFDSLRRFVFAGATGAAYYLESASVVSYIDRTYGRAKLRELWRTGGFGGAERTLGVSAAVLERRWRASIARHDPPASWPPMWREIHAHGCE